MLYSYNTKRNQTNFYLKTYWDGTSKTFILFVMHINRTQSAAFTQIVQQTIHTSLH